MLKKLMIQNTRIQSLIVALLLIMMTAVVFIQVVARKVSPIPIPWTEELSRLAMIWLTYLGLAATFHRKIHIRVDLIDMWIRSERTKRWSNRMIDLLGILFSGALVYLSWTYFSEQLNHGQTTSIMNIPMWLVILPILVGSVLTLLHFILGLFVPDKEETS